MQNKIYRESNSLYVKLRELIVDCKKYVITHPFFSSLIIIESCLAYGFHATHYSFHGDALISEYYSGTALISAGRFCAPLIHYLSGLMNFAPFWQTVVMGFFLVIAGLLWGMVYQKASGNILSDNAVFVFWAIMITFPIMYEQLTYPNILIALAYAMVPVAIYILMPVLQGEASINIVDFILATLLLTICVDIYESFASVYLVGIVSVLLLRYLFEAKNENIFRQYALILVKLIAILSLSIVTDYVLSKLVCYIYCDTFDFWYTNNTKVYWGDLGIIDGTIWLIRNVFVYYILGGTQSLSWFLFNLCSFSGLIIAIIICIRRKSLISLLLFTGLFMASISLTVVVDNPMPDRTAQAIPIYVATVGMCLFHYACKKKIVAPISWLILAVFCLNQTLTINNYAVTNYDRHIYETRILRQVGDDLKEFPVYEKPVVFIGSEENLDLPDSLRNYKDDVVPIIADVQELFVMGWKRIIPDSFYKKMSGWYGGNNTIKNFDDLIDLSKNDPIISLSFIKYASEYKPWFETDIYRAMRHLGYELLSTDQQTYESAKKYICTLPCYPNEGYIYEADDLIIVNMRLK